MATRLLVTGSDGLVGTNILPALMREFEVIPFVESQWDITNKSRGEEVFREARPGVLLNLAAMTDVDGCEDRKESAFRVNAEGPAVLARICARLGVRMLHFSTDYVFDGSKGIPYNENDAVNPLSAYGESKRRGEEMVLASLPSAVILRTEWIYGRGGENFITKVVRAAKERGRVEVVDDQTGSPTFAADLARCVMGLIRMDARGIYHATNSGSCTWYQFARHVFSLLGIDTPCVPITSEAIKRKARRPAYSVFDCSKLAASTGVTMRIWQEALEEYLIGNESDIFLRRPPVGK